MSVPLTINGVTFPYPVQGDLNWGPVLTNWSTAVTNGMLQKAGGSFTLTSEVDFGASFGLKALSYKSKETNIAATGILRLANASAGIVWRNQLNNADLALTVNSSNQLTFNGVNVGATTSLTDSHVLVGNASNQPADVAMTGDIAITNTGVTSIGSGVIVNADVNAGAAIDVSKLAALTASRIVTSDASGFLTTTASPTLTELSYLGGVTSAIQTQLNTLTTSLGNYLPLAGGTMSGAINMGSHKITSLTAGSNTGEAIGYRQNGEAVNGSTANSGGSAGTIQQGTVSTPDLRANAVSQSLQGTPVSSGVVATTSIGSISITTIGGPVLLFCSSCISLTGATLGGNKVMDYTLGVRRDSTDLHGQFVAFTITSPTTLIADMPASFTYLDSPAAGSYTYTLYYGVGHGSAPAVLQSNIVAVELRK